MSQTRISTRAIKAVTVMIAGMLLTQGIPAEPVASNGVTQTHAGPWEASSIELKDGVTVSGRSFDFSSGNAHGCRSESFTGSVSFSTDTGLCLQVPAKGENMGEWYSPEGAIPLVPDSVWHIEMQVTCDQPTSGSVPLWSLFIDNYAATLDGPFGYGGSLMVLDNAGSANAAGLGRTNFHYWFTPAAISTPQWTGFDWASVDEIDDMRLHFRVLDLDSNGIHSQADSGTLCLRNITIDRFDLADLRVEETIYDQSDGLQPGEVTIDAPAAAHGALNSGAVEVDPVSPIMGFGDSVVTITPGRYTGNEWVTGGAEVLDNVPVPWERNVLYRFRASLRTRGGEANPSDTYRLGFDSPTNELMSFSRVTPGLGHPFADPAIPAPGTPRLGSAAEYQMFMYSHSPSASSTENFDRLRPRIDVLNAEDVVLGGIHHATDGWAVETMVVEKVSFTEPEPTPTPTPSPIEMVDVPAGTFTMGRVDYGDDGDYGWADEQPRHEVTLSAYRIGTYEITNGQYGEVMNWALAQGRLHNKTGEPYRGGDLYRNCQKLLEISSPACQISYDGEAFVSENRDGFSMEDHPVVEVTWYGAVAFCNWRSEMEGLEPCYEPCTWELKTPCTNGYRLPTEAEWERAAAWDGMWHWTYGNHTFTDSTNQMNYDETNPLGLSRYPYTTPAGYYDGSAGTTDSPSPVGAYDMSGNVWEWCHDRYGKRYYANGTMTDPHGPVIGLYRVGRGGGWCADAPYCRTAYRIFHTPSYAVSFLGFRTAKSF